MTNRYTKPAMYGLPLLYIASIYGSIILFFQSISRPEQTDAQTVSAFLWLLLPIGAFLVNLILLNTHKKDVDRIYYLNSAVMIKYSLIPLYLIGAAVILMLLLAMVVPALIMISPLMIGILCIFGWLYMAGGSIFSIPYLFKSASEGVHSKVSCALSAVCQFFFCLDVISVVILALKERRCVKSTILVLTLLLLLIVLLIFAMVMGNAN